MAGLEEKVSNSIELKPRIAVLGIGGAGSNAVNNMIKAQLEGVEFLVCNTDSQALNQALTEKKMQLGASITQGLGAGARPEVGQAAAEESIEEIISNIRGCNMLFVTAGMGGGTGTGASPVIARVAREQGILTVGVVTKPFHFEGIQRMRSAEKGLEELQKYIDTLIVIPNQNLFRVANENTTFADAFKMADEVLYSGVRSVTDLMIMPGLINLDFADVKSVMGEMGKAMMGTGEAEGEGRAIMAAEAAIANPLLDDVSMKGAKGILISITGGLDMTLFEVDEAANRVREEIDTDANIIFGSTFDERLSGRIRVSVVATGIDSKEIKQEESKATVNADVDKELSEDNSSSDLMNSDNIEEESNFDDAFPNSNIEDPIALYDSASSDTKEEKANKPMSFFQRLLRRSSNYNSMKEDVLMSFDDKKKSLDNKDYTNVVKKEESDELTEKKSMTSDEDLEIPTFLRRKGK